MRRHLLADQEKGFVLRDIVPDGVVKILRNSLASALAGAVEQGSNLVIVILLARLLESSDVGRYTFALSVSTILQILVTFGLPLYLTREISKHEERASSLFSSAWLLASILGVAATALVFLVFFGFDLRDKWEVCLLSLTVYPSAIVLLCRSVFTAFQRMHVMALAAVVSNILKIVLCYAALWQGQGLLVVILAFVVARYVAMGINLVLVSRSFARIRVPRDLGLIRRLARESWVFFLMRGVSAINTQTDVVILWVLVAPEALGFYSAANRLVQILAWAQVAVMGAVFPVIVRSYVSSKDAFRRISQSSVRYLMMAALPIAVGTTLLSERLAVMFYGEEFSEAAPVLGILVWAFLLDCINSVLWRVTAASDNQRVGLINNIVTMVFMVVLRVVLTGPWGLVGAALAMPLSYALKMALFYLFVSRNLFHLSFARLIYRPLIAALGMGGFLALCRGASLVVLLPAAAAVYLVILLTLESFAGTGVGRVMRYAFAWVGNLRTRSG